MKVAAVAGLYILFCLLSMGSNIGMQAIAAWAYHGPFSLFVAMFLGTGIGLVVKYLLDRKWIFAHTSRSATHEARTAALYTAMGLVTTAVFWSVEWLFNHLLGEPYRYVGAVIGLTIGYTAKYFLDKHYVFARRTDSAHASAG